MTTYKLLENDVDTFPHFLRHIGVHQAMNYTSSVTYEHRGQQEHSVAF